MIDASSLKNKKDFRSLAKDGRKVRKQWLILDFQVLKAHASEEKSHKLKSGISFGLSVSKKVGSAVTRNKIKRWCRIFFRQLTKDAELMERLSKREIKLNLRFRERDEYFYKKIQYREFLDVLEDAWREVQKSL